MSMVQTSGLPLPRELSVMIESGAWPSTKEAERQQNVEPLVPRARVKAIIPAEQAIILFAPPFQTISEAATLGEEFWCSPEASLSQIDPRKSLLIADFGVGSDTAIVLDYRQDAASPVVMRLSWANHDREYRSQWVPLAPTFADFCTMFGIGGR